MTVKEVQNWSAQKWSTQMVYARPSGGGAVGVVFVWASRAFNPQAFNDPSTATFVIKPIKGAASPTKFAEYALAKIGGASSPNSKPVARNSPPGNALVNALKIFRGKETNAGRKQRWGEVMTHYDSADYFLIQETQVGIAEVGDKYREHRGLIEILQNQELMTNLGKLFAADAFIGNGDRLCKMNMGNVVFKPNGIISSIDSATVLTNFEKVKNDPAMISWGSDAFWGEQTPQTWAEHELIKKGGGAVPAPGQKFSPPTFNLDTLFNRDTWWKETFMRHLEDGRLA